MKHLAILLIVAFIFMNESRAQKLTNDTLTVPKSYSYYMQKRNTNNTIGWVCLGSGLTLGAVGLLMDIGSAFNHGSGSKGDAVAVAGEIIAIASIPFFISAHHNKKKASLYVNRETFRMNDVGVHQKNFTSVSLAVSF